VKYPKLAAAIDEILSKAVKEHGEDALEAAVAFVMTAAEPASSPEGAKEKPVAIPVTKELVLSEQTEVRNGN
jgi:hypothetical protein